ncbi:unnamed protein product [Didymodactylos carnosus]|uniref:Tropomodulin n=1 Tax=Didymodactylos carnosus TaxID=1234261 RepID=A0A816DR37_9BILA|nr:unnamed protein product [Didymodactylos carnosus]CAF4551412.1 unnamed protein product [Didymodactylos carnosus]
MGKLHCSDALTIIQAREVGSPVQLLKPGFLNLSDKQLSWPEVNELADVLKVNKTLNHLNLDSNNISKEAAIAIADALNVNDTLTRLWVANNNISNEIAICLEGQQNTDWSRSAQ